MPTPKINLLNVEISEKSNQILETTQKALGFIPNMYLGMAANTSTIDSYAYAYESFRKNSGFTPVEQEVIFLSVSYYNNCEYCLAAHSFVGDVMTKVPFEVTNAIRDGKEILDKKLNALYKFTTVMTEKRGWPSQDDLEEFLGVGYSEEHILGVITGIAVKTISNYSNHLTQPTLDKVFEERKWIKSI